MMKIGSNVKGGPQLWVSTLLYEKGDISTKRIWDEYVRDRSKKFNRFGQEDADLIPSKNFLKERVLDKMLLQGFVKKSRAIDIPDYKVSGWELVPEKAFKNTAPEILAKLDPLPKIDRADYKQYLRDHNIPYEF
jgi:hypothetical protein